MNGKVFGVLVVLFLLLAAVGFCILVSSDKDPVPDAAVADEADVFDAIGITDVADFTDDNGKIFVAGNLITDLRDVDGALALRYETDYTGDATGTRVNVTLTDGDAASAFLFITDGVNTYEIFMTGFFGPIDGLTVNDISILSPATSLTFFGTAAGSYTITFELVDVVGAGGVLSTQTTTVLIG